MLKILACFAPKRAVTKYKQQMKFSKIMMLLYE